VVVLAADIIEADLTISSEDQTEYFLINFSEIKEKSKNDKISLQGIMSVAADIFGKNIIYLVDVVDASAGLQLYSTKVDFSAFSFGDVLEVKGRLSAIQGESRLLVDQVSVLGRADLLTPSLINIGDLNDDLVGGLISVSGEAVEKKGSNLYLDDGTGEIRVYFKKDASIKLPEIKEGYQMSVSGILSLTNSGYRLLPRSNDDINIGQVLGASEEKAAGLSTEVIQIEPRTENQRLLKYLFGALAGLLMILLSLIIKIKIIKPKSKF